MIVSCLGVHMHGAASIHYEIDSSWQPAFPAGTGSFAAVDVVGDRVFVGQRNTSFSDPMLVFDRTGKFLYSFGAAEVGRGVHHGSENWGVHGVNVRQPTSCSSGSRDNTVWVSDFLDHKVLTYTLDGKILDVVGHGASSDKDKFDSPAEVAFHCDSAFFVDGDGGANMRVSRWELKNGLLDIPVWEVPETRPEKRATEVFDHPHSIAWHETTSRLIVADRDHWRIVLMDPDSATITGNVTCDLDLGPESMSGRPFGVRTWRRGTEDLLLVEVAGNDAVETNHQKFHVLDARGFANGSCSVLQSLSVDPLKCHTLHLLALDQTSGDVYFACNQQPHSNVIRLTRRSQSVIV